MDGLCRTIAVLAGFGVCSCPGATGCRKADAQQPEVILVGREGKPVRVRVEVVTRPEELARGLMYRDRLAPDSGMLFVYPDEDYRYFWMKNTYIPLDMVFISAKRRIVGTVENAQPLTLERREVDAPSQLVLEVNAGFVRRHGIKSGSRLEIRGVEGFEP